MERLKNESSNPAVSEESFPKLATELCQQFLGPPAITLEPPRVGREGAKTRLRKAAYGTFFTSRLQSSNSDNDRPLDLLRAITFDLRRSQCYDVADRIDHVSTALLDDDSNYLTNEAVIRFLLLLARPVYHAGPVTIGQVETWNSSTQQKSRTQRVDMKGFTQSLGAWPDYLHGEEEREGSEGYISSPSPPPFQYDIYPRELFENTITVNDEVYNQLQPLKPLPNLMMGETFTIPSHSGLAQSQALSLDEGFVTPGPGSVAGSDPELYRSLSDINLQPHADLMTSSLFTFDGPRMVKPRTWENRLRLSCLKEKPYLCEAGPDVFDQIYDLHLSHLSLYNPGLSPGNFRTISMDQLVKDCTDVLFCLPSATFSFDETTQAITYNLSTRVSGLSPPALQSLCSSFAEAGALHWRLEQFSDLTSHLPCVLSPSTPFVSPRDAHLERSGAATPSPRETTGLLSAAGTSRGRESALSFDASSPHGHRVEDSIFRALQTAVEDFLQTYRQAVLGMRENSQGHPGIRTITALGLKGRLQPLLDQIRFVAKICHCEQAFSLETLTNFPTGVSLLSYLYETALHQIGLDQYHLSLCLLRHCCEPYLMFVHEWVFSGTMRTIQEEFNVVINEANLARRDRRYWSGGHTLKKSNMGDNFPLFLRDMAKSIFSAGKSLNLLRTCCPKHYLCNLNEELIPTLSLTFSQHTLALLTDQWEAYVAGVERQASQSLITRSMLVERADKARQELVIRAKTSATRGLEAIQGRLREARAAATEKKRVLFAALKVQMEKERERVATVALAQREEEQRRNEERRRREELAREIDEQLEQQARSELVAYYTRLTKEAGVKEQRALWRVARHRLSARRTYQVLAARDRVEEDILKLQKKDDSVVVTVEIRAVPSRIPLTYHAYDSTKGAQSFSEDSKDSRRERILDRVEEELDARRSLPPSPEKPSIYFPDPTNVTKETAPGSTRPSVKCNEVMAATMVTADSTAHNLRTAVRTFADTHATAEAHQTAVAVRPRNLFGHTSDPSREQHRAGEPPRLGRPLGQGASLQSVVDESKVFQIRSGRRRKFTRGASSETTEENRRLCIQLSPTKAKAAALEESEIDRDLADERKFTSLRAGKEHQLGMNEEPGYRAQIKVIHDHVAVRESVEVDRHTIAARLAAEQRLRHAYAGGTLRHSSDVTSASLLEREDVERLNRFRKRNTMGHSSDSTVQKILYGVTDGRGQVSERLELDDISQDPLFRQLFEFTDSTHPPPLPRLENLPGVNTRSCLPSTFTWEDGSCEKLVDKTPLLTLLHRSVCQPLNSQISLVNTSVLSYFMVEMCMDDHFLNLRGFLLMEKGEFAQTLTDLLFDKLAGRGSISEILNPAFLNEVLSRSLAPLADNLTQSSASLLSFVLNPAASSAASLSSSGVFSRLHLQYKVEWPLNIVISEDTVVTYNRIFTFMVELKRLVHALKDVWSTLKRAGVIHKASHSQQFMRVQLYRNEMVHFVTVMQTYISSQVIHVSWQEFQHTLQTDVTDLDSLCKAHARYLNNCLCRCLLNRKANKVMSVIRSIFALVLKFHSQCKGGGGWTVSSLRSGGRETLVHPRFSAIESTHRSFKEHTRFLFQVLSKLAARGYQVHLQELLLHLNYNHFYKPAE